MASMSFQGFITRAVEEKAERENLNPNIPKPRIASEMDTN